MGQKWNLKQSNTYFGTLKANEPAIDVKFMDRMRILSKGWSVCTAFRDFFYNFYSPTTMRSAKYFILDDLKSNGRLWEEDAMSNCTLKTQCKKTSFYTTQNPSKCEAQKSIPLRWRFFLDLVLSNWTTWQNDTFLCTFRMNMRNHH